MKNLLLFIVSFLIWWSIVALRRTDRSTAPRADQTIMDILPAEQVLSWNTTSWDQIISWSSDTKTPILYSLNKPSYTYGDLVEIRGQNLYAVENDKVVIIENSQWKQIRLDTIRNQWHSYISFVVPSQICTVLEGESGIWDCSERWGQMIDIPKWTYKLYYPDFEQIHTYSNALDFIIR